eukprot:SAG25_NODE_6559_length_551_cov_0.676991_1_plen_86_part_00
MEHSVSLLHTAIAVPDCDPTWIPPDPSWDEAISTEEEDRPTGIKGQQVVDDLNDSMEMFEPPPEKMQMVRPATNVFCHPTQALLT